MKTCANNPSPTPPSGFSLIEMVGVLTIIAILSLALVPSVMSQMKQAALTREVAEMAGLRTALTNRILSAKSIPNQDNWVSALAAETAAPASRVATNASKLARIFLIDPALQIGGGGLPFTQTTNGTARPASARVMLVSSLSQPLPIASGVPSVTNFNDIWNTPAGSKPATWGAWTGSGETLIIERANLEPLFHRVTLLSADPTAAGAVSFAIDGSLPLTVPSVPPGWSRYYLRGTVVSLFDTNNSTVVREILNSDLNRFYEFDGVWRPRLVWGLRIDAFEFAKLAQQFLDTDLRKKAKADQIQAVDLMYVYMFNYVLWAQEEPCFACYGVKPNDTAQGKMMVAARDRLKDVMGRIVDKK